MEDKDLLESLLPGDSKIPADGAVDFLVTPVGERRQENPVDVDGEAFIRFMTESMGQIRRSVEQLSIKQEVQSEEIKALSAVKKGANKGSINENDSDSSKDRKTFRTFNREGARFESNRRTTRQASTMDDSFENFLQSDFNYVNPIRGSNANANHTFERRQSAVFANAAQADSKMPDNVIRLQPNFDDIQLTKLNIPSVIRFLNQVNEYQQKYNIPLLVKRLLKHLWLTMDTMTGTWEISMLLLQLG